MSKRLALIVISAAGLAAGVMLLSSSRDTKARRHISSIDFVTSKKKEILGKRSPFAKLRHTTKLSSPIRVSLTSSTEVVSANESFTLTATLATKQNLDNVVVEWSLPESIEIVSGARKVTLSELKAHQPETIEIRLVSRSSENQQIHVAAKAEKGSTKFSEIAQFNTVSGPDIAKSKLELLNRSRAYMDKYHKTYH